MPGELWYPLLALTGILSLPVLVLGLFRVGTLASVVSKEATVISVINNAIGKTVGWAILFMVLVQFAVVIMRYTFGVNFIALQESVIYAHATLFMLGAGYTLLIGGHVRVDIFYHAAPERRKAWIDFLGTFLFLMPFMLIILHFSWNYVEIAWRIKETSRESSGLPWVYILKAVILGFASQMLLQGIAEAGKAALKLSGHDKGENA